MRKILVLLALIAGIALGSGLDKEYTKIYQTGGPQQHLSFYPFVNSPYVSHSVKIEFLGGSNFMITQWNQDILDHFKARMTDEGVHYKILEYYSSWLPWKDDWFIMDVTDKFVEELKASPVFRGLYYDDFVG